MAEEVIFREIPACHSGVKIHMVTPSGRPFIHTFFDVSPISPSGRYLACLRLPFEDRIPAPGERAMVCLIDLHNRVMNEVAETAGWGMQTGAHIVWGADDDALLFNDVTSDYVHGNVFSMSSGELRSLDGPVYHVGRDGQYVYSPNLNRINIAQIGYGASLEIPPHQGDYTGSNHEDGLWRTDVAGGKTTLIFSLEQARNLLPDPTVIDGYDVVFFHVKVNRQNDRLMLVVRCCRDDGHQIRFIVTMNPDGEDVSVALPWELWMNGSHHPDWHPDGRQVSMNLNFQEIRFFLFGHRGDNLHMVCPHIKGGGHPSYSRDGRYLLTDAYTTESFANDKGEVPLRLIDTWSGVEQSLGYIPTVGSADISDIQPGLLRCDLHPVWCDRDRKIVFNGTENGVRQVFVAELETLENKTAAV